MHGNLVFSGLVAILLVGTILAAPFKEAQAKEKRDAVPSQKVADQESQLENLVSLAGEKTKGDNVAVHESHVSHYENKNGEEIKTEKTEEKVTDTKTGKVLADVKQISETGTDGKGEPKKVTETEVDIPDEGVHETFVKDDTDETEMEPIDAAEAVRANIEMSPAKVARYLLESLDFDNFYTALKDLVASNVMSQEEAEGYEQEVITEYQKLVAEQTPMSGNILSEEPESAYYAAYDEPEMKRLDIEPMVEQVPENIYGLDRAYDNYFDADLDLNRQALMGGASGEEESISNIIDALLNAWWEKDFEGGNARALALVSYLDDIVSRDNNPDDIGQIRDILADMLADALLEDVENAEAEYKIEQAQEETMPDNNQESGSQESTEAEVPEVEETPEAEKSPEEELNEVAQTADKSAEEGDETSEESSESEKKKKSEESEEKEKKDVKPEDKKH